MKIESKEVSNYVDTDKIRDNNAEFSKEEPVSVEEAALANALTKYIKDKHTQEECIGFSDGFKEAKEQDKAIISELLKVITFLEKGFDYSKYEFVDVIKHEVKETITKATEYLNK